EYLRPPRRPPPRDRGLRARGPRARRLERVHAALHGHPPARRRPRGGGGGRHLRRNGPACVSGRRAEPPARGPAHDRELLAGPRGARAVAHPTRARALARLPPLGVRVRGPRPRARPVRALAGRGARPRRTTGHLRRLAAAARAAERGADPPAPRALPEPALQARSRELLGRRADRGDRRHRRRRLGGLQGRLRGDDRRPARRPSPLPRRHRDLPARVDRGPEAPARDRGHPRRPPRPDHLGRGDPLGRRHRRAALPAAHGQPEALALRLAASPVCRLRCVRGARHRRLRRRPVRARSGARTDPVSGLAVSHRHAQRRRARRLQRAGPGARAPRQPARARALAHRVPLGRLGL
ncbi:MAG: hypothetical protein AVDCRST_MAG45-2066, partial [uncultured Solirubrobacterales bacterium]